MVLPQLAAARDSGVHDYNDKMDLSANAIQPRYRDLQLEAMETGDIYDYDFDTSKATLRDLRG